MLIFNIFSIHLKLVKNALVCVISVRCQSKYGMVFEIMTFAMPDMGSQGIFCTANLLNYLSVTDIKISMKPKEQMDSQIKPLKNYSRWYILQNFNSIKLASSVDLSEKAKPGKLKNINYPSRIHDKISSNIATDLLISVSCLETLNNRGYSTSKQHFLNLYYCSVLKFN